MVGSIVEHFATLPASSEVTWEWPFKNYKSTVIDVARAYGAQSLCEIGGGRAPMLDEEVVHELGARYTLLDVDQTELDKAPLWPDKVCGDIADADLRQSRSDRYDLIFSHMVMEHVRDARQAYANMFDMLRPGGIVINFHPTLYAVPFIINYLIPVQISRAFVQYLDPHRGNSGRPVFPARYSWCVSTHRAERMIQGVGFREVVIVPFWGHSYFLKLPVIRTIDELIVSSARNRGLKALSSYAYSVARK